MLTYSELNTLARSTRHQHVLQAYVDASELDAVARRAWRRNLDAALEAVEKAATSTPHAERTELRKAAAQVNKLVRKMPDDLDGAAGWVVFATADGVLHQGPVDRAVRTEVRWLEGVATAPYLRLIEPPADVIVAVVDTRTTDVFAVRGRTLDRITRLEAHAHVGRAAHMGDAAREGFHSGTRGTALSDAAQRALEVGRERMLHDLAGELEGLARPNGWIVVAGARTTAHDAIRHLGKAARKRTAYVPGLRADASDADVVALAAEGRRRLEMDRDLARVADVVDRAAARGRAALGFGAVSEALRRGAVSEVLVTSHVLDERADAAESLALDALAHGAHLTELTGDAGTRLDAEADGVAATLRFPGRMGQVAAGLAGAEA